MSERDAWARLTPYELGLPGREFAEEHFDAIQAEAESGGVDLRDPGAFLRLGGVARVVGEVHGGGTGSVGDEGRHQLGVLLFHAYHFHRAGERLFLIETDALRSLLSPEPPLAGIGGAAGGPWSGTLPSDAGYLQLPLHLVWSDADSEEPAEPLDGIFWSRSADESLSVMPALGLRRDRPGLSLMSFPPVPLADAESWIRDPARPGGTDFETTLPGGEIEQLYTLVTMGETLKLMGRVFAYIEAHPESLGTREEGPDEAEETGGGMDPSHLPFRRIRLVT